MAVSLDGAYNLHLNGYKPAGYFEDFTRQLKVFWKADAPAKSITQAERQQMADIRAQREKQQQRKHEQAADNDNRKDCPHCEAVFYIDENPTTCPKCGKPHKLENTGIKKAKQAAFAVGGFVAIPPIRHGDFNDYANREVGA